MLFIDNPIALFLAILTVLGILVIIFKKKKTPPAPIKLRQPLNIYQKEQIVTTIKTESLPATLMSLTLEEKEVDNLVEKHIKVEKYIDNDSHYDVDLDLSNYKYPVIELLDGIESGLNITAEELDLKKQTMLDIMSSFGIEIDKLRATVGPTFTFYELIPSPGVRISKIKNLENDIAVSLGISGVHVVGHIPGTHTVGIEVPNGRPDIVSMRSVLTTEKFRDTVMDLPIALGKSMTNEVVILDLAELSHLLIVGGYGHGKSVALNALIVSLLYKKHPSQLKFVLIDISRGEFIMYNKIERHFLAKLPNESEAVVTKSSKVFETLNSLSVEIDRRYNLLNNGQVRNVKDYNEKFIALKLNLNNGHRFLPFIVVVIDEFANLISTMDKEIEFLISRIAQQGRAVGIHLVISVQGISVNILTGTLKANFTSRVAFKVSSINDSKTILDIGGAEKLTGNGDMLFLDGPNLVHLQGAFVSPAEVEKVTEFIGFQRGYPTAMSLPEYFDEAAENAKMDFDVSDRDSLFEDAARLIVLHQQASTSLIQRKLKLGYNRAGRIIDQLEAASIVGPFEGSKVREVLFKDAYSLEQYLDSIGM